MAGLADDAAPRAGKAAELSASPPMFRSRLLDMFTRVHPAVVPIVYLPVTLLLLYRASSLGLSPGLALFVGGYVLWTLFEYWGHRLVFHYEPDHPLGARLHWIIHGVHHDHPSDPLRLVLPPLASIPIMLIACGALALLLDGPVLAAVAAGFVAGYVLYDMTHYYLHHFTPRTRLGRALRARHMHHHFRDDRTAYGVSAPWWDAVFGTSVKKTR